jgi:hypothetical protein
MDNALAHLKKHIHTYLMWFWILMIPVTLIWLKDSVLWVALMSLYANIESSAAAREAKKQS